MPCQSTRIACTRYKKRHPKYLPEKLKYASLIILAQNEKHRYKKICMFEGTRGQMYRNNSQKLQPLIRSLSRVPA